jgi:hypothetical protein
MMKRKRRKKRGDKIKLKMNLKKREDGKTAYKSDR